MTRAMPGPGIQLLSAEDFGSLSNPGVESVQLVWPRNARGAHVTVTRVTMQPGTDQKLHCHPGAEQTWIVEGGAATMLSAQGGRTPIQAGDVLRTSPGTFHGLVNEGAGPFVYLTITTPPQDFATSYAAE